jgi:hypothetical protein
MSNPTNFVTTLIAAVASDAQQTGWFESVGTEEPKSAPGAKVHFATWLMNAKPARTSDLVSTSFRIELAGRIYMNMLREPTGTIDGDLASAGWDLLGRYSGAFTLGGLIREVDLLGEHGEPLAVQFGYVNIDHQLFRIADVTIPLIADDCFDQAV